MLMGKTSRALALLLGLLLALTIGAGAAGAAITEDEVKAIQGALELIEKLEALQDNQDLALEAVDIAIGIVESDSTTNEILTQEQRNAIASLGLDKNDVKTVLQSAKDKLSDQNTFNNLVSGNEQLSNIINFYNELKSELDPQILSKLDAAGVTETILIETAVDLANSTYDPYQAIPKEDLEAIFNEHSPVSAETASKYGLNYTNVEKLRQHLLNNNQLDTFKEILEELNLYAEPATGGTTGGGGGGGGGGAATEPSDPGKAADKAEDVVNAPDATDDEVADAVDNAAESLDSSIDKAESPEDVEEAADTAGKLSETLVKAAGRIQDAGAAGKVGEAAAKLAGALAKAAGKAATDDAKDKIEAAALNILDAASTAVDKMDAAKAIDVAEKMIQSTGTIAKALKGEAVKNIAARAARLAQEAVERAGTDKISQSEVKLEGDKASVEADPVRLKERAEEAIRAAKELAEQLKENGLDAGKRLQARVVVEVPATGKEQVETKLPAGTFEALADIKVDKLEVKTEVASFSVAPDTFGEEAKGKDVILAAARVKREDLPAAARNRVPPNSIVVDLDASVGGSRVSNFNNPVEVSIPYTLGEDENPGEVTVFLLKDDGSVQKMGGKYDPATGTVKFRTSHFSKYFARTARGAFTDLDKFKWAKDTIEIMAGKGFIAGRTATAFDPGADITRAEFSALAVRMLALSAPDSLELPFKDVPEDAWYRQVVAAAYANNVVSGKAADVFDPNGKITRQEMAVIISRIMMAEGFEAGNVNDLDSFTDKEQIAGWARNGAALATREGIVKGMPGGKFAPGAKANRAQAAVMLYRLFNKLY